MPKLFSAETLSDRVLPLSSGGVVNFAIGGMQALDTPGRRGRSMARGRRHLVNVFAGLAPIWWIDLIKRPGRHRSAARPFRSPCESPHRSSAARYPAAAPITWPPPTPPRVNP
jgi:hypothetical protein